MAQITAGGRHRTTKGFGRDFWIYFAGQTISVLGTSFTFFALPLVVFKLTGSATNLAFTTAAEFVPYLLFGLLLGAVTDRVDRKRMMIGVDLARGAVIVVLPILFVLGELRVEYIYAVAFVQSTLGILFDAGEFAAIPSLVGKDALVAANGRIQATLSAGQVFGPVLAGVLVAFMSPADLLFVDAASFVVSGLMLSTIGRSFNEVESTGGLRPEGGSLIRGLLRDVREGLSYVWQNPVLRSISIMMALINFVSTTQNTQLVLFAKRALNATDSQVGWLYAAGGAGIVATGLAAGPLRRRFSFRVVALGTLVMEGLCVTGMALVGWYPGALLLWGLSNGFAILLNINTGSLRQAIVPNHMLGRIISIAGVIAWSAIPLGALAGAAMIRITGSVTAVYAGCGVVSAAIAAAFAFSPIRQGDRYLAEAAARDAAAKDAGLGGPAPEELAPVGSVPDGDESLAMVNELRPEPRA